jgi:hypothetical protein
VVQASRMRGDQSRVGTGRSDSCTHFFLSLPPPGVVCASGSLCLSCAQWDSRTIHWNRTPTADQLRVVVYVCFAPKAMASEEVLAIRKDCFEKRLATTHWCVFCLFIPLWFLSPTRFRRSPSVLLGLFPSPVLTPSPSRRPAPHITVPLTEYGPAMRGDQIDPLNRDRPFQEPEVTEQMLKLVGSLPY